MSRCHSPTLKKRKKQIKSQMGEDSERQPAQPLRSLLSACLQSNDQSETIFCCYHSSLGPLKKRSNSSQKKVNVYSCSLHSTWSLSSFFGFCYSCWHASYSYWRGERLLIFRHQLFQPLKDFSLSFLQLISKEPLFNSLPNCCPWNLAVKGITSANVTRIIYTLSPSPSSTFPSPAKA